MIFKHVYLVGDGVILMTSEYDNHGKLCARVMIGKKTLLVDRSPVQLLDDSLKYIGFDLKGALNGAKEIVGNKYMSPVIVNPYKDLCLFPTKSPKKEDCIWFNPTHIAGTKHRGSKTEVVLSNGLSLIVDIKLPFFITRMHTAIQLQRMSKERGNNANPEAFFLVPKKERPLSKMANGRYNFSSLAEYNGKIQ